MLLAGASLLLASLNWNLNMVGTPGLSIEEVAMVLAAFGLMGVGRWANQEHEIPDLMATPARSNIEGFDIERTAFSNHAPTEQQGYESTNTPSEATKSILHSILGTNTQANAAEVSSAIHTLSTGQYGAMAAEEMVGREPMDIRANSQREALPVDSDTGTTLSRNYIEPVPLPGKEEEPTVDPRTIPGLQADREFVSDGLEHIPLPGLPILDETVETSAIHSTSEEITDILPSLDLPDLGDLFMDEAPPIVSAPVDLPDLPDLDDLF